jgi:hypothetical protein
MRTSTKEINFLEKLKVPEGPKAGEVIELAPFQKQFVKGGPPMITRHPEPTKTSQSRLDWQ